MGFPPKSSHFNVVFSMIFTIHFGGGFPPIFSETTQNHGGFQLPFPPSTGEFGSPDFLGMPSTPRTNQEVAIKVYKATRIWLKRTNRPKVIGMFKQKKQRQAPKDPHKGEDVRLQKFRRRERLKRLDFLGEWEI